MEGGRGAGLNQPLALYPLLALQSSPLRYPLVSQALCLAASFWFFEHYKLNWDAMHVVFEEWSLLRLVNCPTLVAHSEAADCMTAAFKPVHMLDKLLLDTESIGQANALAFAGGRSFKSAPDNEQAQRPLQTLDSARSVQLSISSVQCLL